MAITRPNNLVASAPLLGGKPDLHVRQANDGVTVEQLAAASRDNGRNEVIVQSDTNASDTNTLFVVDARRLSTDGLHSVRHGDTFELGSIKGQVVHTDLAADLKASPLRVLGAAVAGLVGLEAAGAALSALGVGAGAVGGMSAALAIGSFTGGVGAALLGAALLMSRESDDAELKHLTTTLASSNDGDFNQVQAQLRGDA